MKQDIYLKNGQLFAKEFVRVVHGGRGDYVEFAENQIIPELLSKFGNTDLNNTDTEYYYYWLFPKNNADVKVYKQLKTVKYADYKIGMYYVSPEMFLNFKDPEKLF